MFEVDFLPNRPGDLEIRDFGQMYQSDLAKIGVKLNIVNLESAAFFDQVNNRKFKGMYQATGTVPGEPSTMLSSQQRANTASGTVWSVLMGIASSNGLRFVSST